MFLTAFIITWNFIVKYTHTHTHTTRLQAFESKDFFLFVVYSQCLEPRLAHDRCENYSMYIWGHCPWEADSEAEICIQEFYRE